MRKKQKYRTHLEIQSIKIEYFEIYLSVFSSKQGKRQIHLIKIHPDFIRLLGHIYVVTLQYIERRENKTHLVLKNNEMAFKQMKIGSR